MRCVVLYGVMITFFDTCVNTVKIFWYQFEVRWIYYLCLPYRFFPWCLHPHKHVHIRTCIHMQFTPMYPCIHACARIPTFSLRRRWWQRLLWHLAAACNYPPWTTRQVLVYTWRAQWRLEALYASSLYTRNTLYWVVCCNRTRCVVLSCIILYLIYFRCAWCGAPWLNAWTCDRGSFCEQLLHMIYTVYSCVALYNIVLDAHSSVHTCRDTFVCISEQRNVHILCIQLRARAAMTCIHVYTVSCDQCGHIHMLRRVHHIHAPYIRETPYQSYNIELKCITNIIHLHHLSCMHACTCARVEARGVHQRRFFFLLGGVRGGHGVPCGCADRLASCKLNV